VDDQALLDGLRARDEAAFGALVDRYGALMTRVAVRYLHSQTLAEEVVQETWIAVLESIDRFEGRSSLKTWLLQILVNRARSRHRREARSVPLSSLSGAEVVAREPDARGPEEKVMARERLALVGAAVRALPVRQRELLLGDVAGWGPAIAADAPALSDANRRVLLHRARVRVRAALAAY
jgi:RNA polymerase sigma-70 factor (ECF subfamily)